MHYFIILILSVLIPLFIVIKKRKTINTAVALKIFIKSLVFFNVGITGVIAFMGHTMIPDKIALYIGWPTGNPFQFEVGIANLMLGVLGIMSLWLEDEFLLAVIVASSIFGIGAFYGHLKELLVNNNYAPGNVGAPLYDDIIRPFVLISLFIWYKAKRKIS